MKKLSYKQIILKTLEAEPTRYFYSYELEKVNTPFGWIGIRGSRDCRELAAKGLIEVNHDEKYARYRAISPEMVSLRTKYLASEQFRVDRAMDAINENKRLTAHTLFKLN